MHLKELGRTSRKLMAWVALLALALVLGCSGKVTQAGGLEVIVETDMPTPATFDMLNLQVEERDVDGGWSVLPEHSYLIPGEIKLPATVTLLAGKTPDEEVRITAEALSGSPPQVLVRRVIEAQVPGDRVGEVLVLLSSRCENIVTCPAAGDSCQPDIGACGPDVVMPVLPFNPGDLLDAGVASSDAGAGTGMKMPDASMMMVSSGDDAGDAADDEPIVEPMDANTPDGTVLVDPCAQQNGGCDSNATCTPTAAGTAACMCNQGYSGTGTTCMASNACATSNGGCSANATCTATGAGTRTCACAMGYSGDGLTCTAINSCATSNGGCSPNGTCTSSGPGTNTCACNTGYTGSGVTCTGIQACATSNGGCAATAKCTSTGPNTRTCACNTGYTGDGMTCTAVNSCLTSNGGCAAQATCTDTGPGTNTCACNTGYTGSGTTCTAINSCATNNGGCSANGTCTSTGPNTNSCACKTGYSGNGVTCTPINSCATNSGGCSANGTCTSSGPGPNSCACNTGDTGNGVS
jgi:hypothetical protein